MHNIEHVDYNNYALFTDDVQRYNVISKYIMLGSASSNYTCIIPKIKNVKFHDPATIVFWEDGTKTVVKCGDDDIFDPEKGLAMAIAKRAISNHGNYYNEIRKWTKGCFKKDSIKKCSISDNLSLYDLFACDYYNIMKVIYSPYSPGMLYGYFDGDSMQWVYTPDHTFMLYNLPMSDNDQSDFISAIKSILENRWYWYADINVTLDVQFHTNYTDSERPYFYTVSLNYHK